MTHRLAIPHAAMFPGLAVAYLCALLWQPAVASGSAPDQSASATTANTAVLEAVKSLYDYNRKGVLPAEVSAAVERPTYTRYKLILNAAHQPPVPALLAVPKNGARPLPLVVLIHGYTASKDGWFGTPAPLVDSLIDRGFAVVASDAPFHGERSTGQVPSDVNDLRDVLIRWTTEQRRMLDALAKRDDIDARRVAVVGASMGAVAAIALAAVDDRTQVVVPAVPPLAGMDRTSVAAVSPFTFAAALRRPALLLMGTKDTYYTTDDARRLFAHIAETRKELFFYDSGHDLPAEWMTKAVEWIVKYLR
jgi:dipeptidyl aminopeptidase/acylaminoacyl peptidase